MIIFSSHRMEHVELFCDDILLIDKGNTLLYGKLENIKNEYPKQKVIYKVEGSKKETSVEKDKTKEYINKLVENGIKNITVEPLSLNDIFIDKVGGVDDK